MSGSGAQGLGLTGSFALPSAVALALLREVNSFEQDSEPGGEESDSDIGSGEENEVADDDEQDEDLLETVAEQPGEDLAVLEQLQRDHRTAVVDALTNMVAYRPLLHRRYCLLYARELGQSIVSGPDVFLAGCLASARAHVAGGLSFAERYFRMVARLQLRDLQAQHRQHHVGDYASCHCADDMPSARRKEEIEALLDADEAMELRKLILSFTSALLASVDEPTF